MTEISAREKRTKRITEIMSKILSNVEMTEIITFDEMAANYKD